MTEHTNANTESGGALGDKLTQVWGSPVLVPLAFLTLRAVHAEPLSVTVRVFLPWHWLPWKRVLISRDSLHLPTSKFGTSGYESKKSFCLFSLFIFLLFF